MAIGAVSEGIMTDNTESIYIELERLGSIYSEAKANRVYLTEFRKSKKSMLMQAFMVDNAGASAAKAEVYAYAHDEYLQVLKGLQSATEYEAATWHKIEVVKMRFEAWRSKRATERAEANLR